MDSKRFLEILEEYYGKETAFLIAVKNKKLGLPGIESQTPLQHTALLDSIRADLKRILSEKHADMVKRKLREALDFK